VASERRSESVLVTVNEVAVPAEAFGRVGLAIEVLVVYAHVRWLVLRRGAVPAVTILRRGLPEQIEGGADKKRVLGGLRFGRAVMRVLRLLPTDSRCLMRSLVLTGLLARRGVYAKVVIGVRPDPASFGAHAWVEVDGQPVLPTDESTYPRLVEI
jgi:Transglutaminase-like superfamily